LRQSNNQSQKYSPKILICNSCENFTRQKRKILLFTNQRTKIAKMSQKTKNIILTSLKAVVSAGLIYFIITRIDLEKFIANISNFPLWALPIVAVAFCATVLIGGWRWKIFIRPFGEI